LKKEHVMTQYDHEAAFAIFIRTKGVTRCPTACVAPTQGLPDAADQAALEQYSTARNGLRLIKIARQRSTTMTVDRYAQPRPAAIPAHNGEIDC
jgi:hypothetical protein